MNVICLLSTTEAFNFQISETVIHNSHSRKLLGVTLNNKLKFEKHITTICGKAQGKLNALARVTSYMDLRKRRTLMNAFFNSQFNPNLGGGGGDNFTPLPSPVGFP